MVQQWTCDVDWSGQQRTCDVMMACVELQVTIMIVMMMVMMLMVMVMMLMACVDIHTYIHTYIHTCISTWIAVVTARRSLKIIRPRPAIMAASWSSL